MSSPTSTPPAAGPDAAEPPSFRHLVASGAVGDDPGASVSWLENLASVRPPVHACSEMPDTHTLLTMPVSACICSIQ